MNWGQGTGDRRQETGDRRTGSGFGPEYQPQGASPRSGSGIDLGALRIAAAIRGGDRTLARTG